MRRIYVMVICLTVTFLSGLVGCGNSAKEDSINKTLGLTIEEKLNSITKPKDFKVSLSSNPYEYIQGADSNKDYNFIVSQGEPALKYMLSKFANSDNDGLKEYIMALACSEILKENPASKNWASGREWYRQWQENKTAGLNTEVFMNNSVGQDKDAEITMENAIPTRLAPGAILKYDDHTKPAITYDIKAIITSPDAEPVPYASDDKQEKPTPSETTKEDDEDRAKEDAFFDSVKEEAKSLPVFNLGYDLPDPEPGLVVIYGSDGYINRYYNENDYKENSSSSE
ncbi:hypothetical protein PALU110988_11200 [Paenibacillus lupini]|uniref:hypothetical protein n=1 Tax=Paenibacillus lupini TaxID=1450204 RepID=UPI0014229229|nr:hypothetical protein [Paenibacillus lupini]NIK22288.1 hypothetical protein [Paenibacillus lupini]